MFAGLFLVMTACAIYFRVRLSIVEHDLELAMIDLEEIANDEIALRAAPWTE